MDLSAILTGIAAILTGAGGVIIVVREFRRRDRRACQQDIDSLSEDVHLLRQDLAAFRRWAFLIRQQALDAGVDASDPPAPHPLAPTDDDGLRRSGHTFRRLRKPHDGDSGRRDD